jgi:hypothetical protein
MATNLKKEPLKPSRPGYMHRTCSVCQEDIPEGEPLLAKSVIWRTSLGNKYVRQRTVALQCEVCAMEDGDWNRKLWTDSPGFNAPPLKKKKRA